MISVIQRVREASVVANGQVSGSIKAGLLLLAGFENQDLDYDLDWMINKIINLRIFNDEKGVMNLSIKDIGGSFLVVSQFTLHASTKKGNRPSYVKAAKPEIAIPLYEQFIEKLRTSSGLVVETGIFGAQMEVKLVNDGPVTIIIDSRNKI